MSIVYVAKRSITPCTLNLRKEIMTTSKEKLILKPAEKFCLTVEEASAYFEINDKKLRQIASEHRDDGICAKHGTKLLIYRPAFEQFLLQTSDI